MLLTGPTSAQNSLYVPGASIAIGGGDVDMREQHGLDFTQVEVDLAVSMPGAFRFTIPHAFDVQKSDFFTPSGKPLMPLLGLGQPVRVKMGYGDRAGQTLLISGFINQISTSFAEGGAPEIEVSGLDILQVMTFDTTEHRLQDKSMRDAVNEVARAYSVNLDFSGTAPESITLDANLQNDLEFLRKVAEQYTAKSKQKWEFFIRAGSGRDTLVFRPRTDPKTSPVELHWGSDLISFKPDIDLGKQVKRFEILGWDEVKKEKIVGVATADKGNKGEPSGGDIIAQAFGRTAVRRERRAVKSKDEADKMAQTELDKLTNNLMKGEGETFGLPDLLPDTSVKLSGIGNQFNNCYYVTKTTHRYDGAGYRTKFSVERPVS
ncbi:hypothetical protein [Sphingomonas bacterium]|uniref:phage late control D family protein n=1 Tax=Sphingomonas bacterium TaxID=1895847 RepID=UPI00262AA0C6|nr:hypothetical protein [Sphingomonas bacterium]MDB5678527.1 phage late control family protein [Sphingomonas bacterium]